NEDLFDRVLAGIRGKERGGNREPQFVLRSAGVRIHEAIPSRGLLRPERDEGVAPLARQRILHELPQRRIEAGRGPQLDEDVRDRGKLDDIGSLRDLQLPRGYHARPFEGEITLIAEVELEQAAVGESGGDGDLLV